MGEHLPCKQGVKGSNPFISTQDIILKCTLKTAYRTNIYASIAFSDLIIRRYTARYETTSRHCFLDEHELKTKCEYRKQVVLSSESEKELQCIY